MAPSECRQVYRRHGESGAAGTVAASAAVDLRHQTLADRPETAWRVRRSLPRLFAVSGVWLDDWTAQLYQEPKVSSIGVLLKPLRVKKRNHSREKKRKQTDSRQQTGKTRKGNAGGASARPGFPGAAGARPLCPSRRQDERFKTATVRSQRFIPCIKLSPCSHAFQQFTKYVSLFHLCPLRLLRYQSTNIETGI